MLSVIAKWTILKGRNAEAVQALERLAENVYKNSPFVVMYTIHTPDFSVTSFPTPPEQEVVFYSVFDGYEGFKQHMQSRTFQDWMEENGHNFLTKGGDLFVISEFLDRKAGFIRPAFFEAVNSSLNSADDSKVS